MEILIRTVDKGPEIDQSKAGDVIAVQPDGAYWGGAELYNPEWRILRVDLLPSEASALVTPALDVPGQHKTMCRRYMVDLAFPTEVGVIHDVSRSRFVAAVRLK